MKRHEAELLRLAETDRDSATIAFLYAEHHEAQDPPDVASDQVPVELEVLRERGWVEITASGRWRTTASGSSALRETEDWRFEVSDTFRVTGREHLFAVGTLKRGVVHRMDWFRVLDQPSRFGHVLGIQLARVADADERLVLALDTEVQVGDVLERYEPLAA